MIDLTPIFQSAIALIAALITAFLIPFIKSKVSAEKYAEMEKWVKIAVEAAEMIYVGAGRGAEKKLHVVNFLESKGYTLDIVELNEMIEAAVLGLQKEGEDE